MVYTDANFAHDFNSRRSVTINIIEYNVQLLFRVHITLPKLHQSTKELSEFWKSEDSLNQ